MDYTVKNPDGTINWPESHKARISAGAGNAGSYSPAPQPVLNRPATSQIAPKAKTFDEIRQDDIKYGQSWNLAATMMAPLTVRMLDKVTGPEELEKVMTIGLETWQKYFHNKLTNK